MKTQVKALLFLALTLTTAQAMAVDESNKTVKSAGVQSPNAFFRVNEALSGNCNFSVIYIMDLSSPGSRAMYATVLSAQANGKPLAAISYNVSPSGDCTATMIEAGS